MTHLRPDPRWLRDRLERARLMLLFTPEACTRHDPWEALEAALAGADIVQVRLKPVGSSARALVPAEAHETFAACLRVLDLVRSGPNPDILVVVDDRVDVARALGQRGLAGVHIGVDDCPPDVARAFLGSELLIGMSTHSLEDVAHAGQEAVNYVGFGPVRATRTKGYESGLGSEACWIASVASSLPLFPIGGIDRTNAHELARVGRAAVGAGILDAEDPGRAALELRAILSAGAE